MLLVNGFTGSDLKLKVQELTQVPLDRQKYMLKGGLSNDSSLDFLKEGQTVMVLGTPDANLIAKPKSENRFIEDLDPSVQMQKLAFFDTYWS